MNESEARKRANVVIRQLVRAWTLSGVVPRTHDHQPAIEVGVLAIEKEILRSYAEGQRAKQR